MRRTNFERDNEILIDILNGWSYRKVADYFNMSVSSVHKASERALNRAIEKNVRLKNKLSTPPLD